MFSPFKKTGQITDQNTMLRTLRIKFIVINMALAVIVLFSSFSLVCYINYMTRLDTVFSELEVVLRDAEITYIPRIESTERLVINVGDNPTAAVRATDTTTSPSATSTSTTPKSTTSTTSKSTTTTPTNSATSMSSATSSASHASELNQVKLVAVYNVNPDGMYSTLYDYTSVSIPEAVILNANETVINSPQDEGYLEQYSLFYSKAPSRSIQGNCLIAYADGSSMKDWQSLVFILVVVGLSALIVFFVINIKFSKWAVKPIAISIKQQQQFTADASHELKTPLTVILANMAILKSQKDDSVESQMQWIDSTQLEAERMQLLVNDMLALSRPDSQKQQVICEDIDYSDLVEGEVLQFESVAFERGVELESSIEAGLYVSGNTERLCRMVGTLVDNACKYADVQETSDEKPRVDVTLVEKTVNSIRANTAELIVHNNGSAIPEEDLPFIFNRFYRADKARTSSKGGYGLGLAIGQEIAKEHNGNITVSSSPEEGTTFTVTLPLIDRS